MVNSSLPPDSSLAWKRWVKDQCSGPALGDWGERLQCHDSFLLNAKMCPNKMDEESWSVSLLQAEDCTVEEVGTRALIVAGWACWCSRLIGIKTCSNKVRYAKCKLSLSITQPFGNKMPYPPWGALCLHFHMELYMMFTQKSVLKLFPRTRWDPEREEVSHLGSLQPWKCSIPTHPTLQCEQKALNPEPSARLTCTFVLCPKSTQINAMYNDLDNCFLMVVLSKLAVAPSSWS